MTTKKAAAKATTEILTLRVRMTLQRMGGRQKRIPFGNDKQKGGGIGNDGDSDSASQNDATENGGEGRSGFPSGMTSKKAAAKANTEILTQRVRMTLQRMGGRQKQIPFGNDKQKGGGIGKYGDSDSASQNDATENWGKAEADSLRE
jgi:single-stranded DNA-binding protein